MAVNDDLPEDLRIIHHPRARRMKLRLDRRDGAPVLVLPPRVALTSGHDFVRQNLEWLARVQAERPAAQAFCDGLVFPFQDTQLSVEHRPDARMGVRREGAILIVSGAADHVNRRVTDWLIRQARAALTEAAHRHAASVGRRIARIRIADQQSRWGSCSSRHVLSFNWRLVMAPSFVLDFVAAHEVAHMVEMNHGLAFHALEARLHHNPSRAEDWLRRHGPELRRWG